MKYPPSGFPFRSVAAICCLLVPNGVGAQTPGTQQPPSQAERPKQGFIRRYTEDWRVLRDLGDSRYLDRIRDIPVGDGSLTFGGSLRLRFENFQDFGAGTRDDGYLLSQIRLHANYWITDDLRVYGESISAFSTPRDLPGGRRGIDSNDLDLQQGFAEYTFGIDGGKVSVRAGRHALLLGKQRLVSPLPWANAFRSWDGVQAIASVGDWTITPFFTFFAPTQKHDFDSADDDIKFWGVYGTGALTDELQGDIYVLGLNNDNQRAFNGTAGTEDRYTVGFRVGLPKGKDAFDADVEAAVQVGEVGAGDVTAFFIDSEFGYTLKDTKFSPRLFGGAGISSGDSGAGGDVGTFNQLFPLGHAYNGYADQLGRQNLIETRVGAQLKLGQRTNMRVAGHLFWRHSDNDAVYNVGGGVLRADGGSDSRYVGGEVDLTVNHKTDFGLVLEAGYSHFFAGTFFEQTGTSNDVDFFYLQGIYVF